MPDAAEPSTIPHAIACMEVWGGNRAFAGWVSVPGNDVHVSCAPFTSGHGGGDIYYLSSCAAGLITRFILADVSGHGVEVAEIADALRKLMRRHINTADQTRFARALNEAFSGLSSDGRFATAVLLTYFAPTDHLIICNAGHPRPLHFDDRSARWRALDLTAPGVIAGPAPREVGIANLPLGVIDPTSYEQFAVPLAPGDMVLVYSDALIEAVGIHGRQIGEEGLLAILNALDPAQRETFAEDLRAAVAAAAGRPDLGDDATMILLSHNASNPPRQTLPRRIASMARSLGIG